MRAPDFVARIFNNQTTRKNLWRNSKAIPLKAKALSFLANENEKN